MGEVNHAERAHALLGGSNAHRWLKCPPSARFEEQFPDQESEAAKEGTLAHEMCELKLRHHFYGSPNKKELAEQLEALKANPLYSPEMMRYTDEYVDFVKEAYMQFKEKPSVFSELKLDFSKYIPDGFGTADCVIVGGDTVHVIDFKYGKGVPVDAVDNTQLLVYSLGAFEYFSTFYNILNFRMSIVQPRLDNNSTWEVGVGKMCDFSFEIKEAADKAFKGDGEFNPGEKQCRFCKARHCCRARADYNTADFFKTVTPPSAIEDSELQRYLERGADVAKWLKEVQEYALSRCLNGHEVAGYKAVAGRSTRKWLDCDGAFAELIKSGIDEALLYEKKPITLTQAEKLVGKKEFMELCGGFVHTPPGAPTLVKDTDKRQAITNTVDVNDAFSGV